MAKGNFGERLKREREMREVTVDELTKGTRIGPRFLDALENEQWDKLPGGVFGRGFVRSIARYLGLDEESLLGEYDLARGEQKHEAPAPYENRLPSPPKWLPFLAVLVIALLLAGLFYGGRYVWRKYEAHRATRQSSAKILPPGELAADAAGTFPTKATDSATARLNLSVSTSVTTRVRVLADHQVVLDAEIAAGDTWHFPANEQFEITAADSSALLLELNGQAMPPLGAPRSSGTIVLGQKDLRQASRGTSQR
ncbi:MAG TPA: RodZ domain-containing protein [Candidatus Saccharimonadales bacterium]|nr:RodZ domain-containing protein [Candidatus Saccharimonadales bacterium]